MKNPINLSMILFIALFLRGAEGTAQNASLEDCTPTRKQFVRLNDHLLLSRDTATEDNPKAMKAGTQALEAFVTQTTLARLSENDDADTIREYLACLQKGNEDTLPSREDTNTPQVFITKKPLVPIAVSSMLIMRGGNAIPYTRPIVQCFSKSSRKWSLIGGSGDDFDSHTFSIYSLKSPEQDELWFLLAGTAFGDTGGRLKLEVVSCSASRYRKVWSQDEFIWGKVQVSPDSVVVSFEKQEDFRTAKANGDVLGPGMVIMEGPDTGNPKKFYETFRVTTKGLEP